jgi:hypothetical protein
MLTIQVNPIISSKQNLLNIVKLTHFVSLLAKYCQSLRMHSEGGHYAFTGKAYRFHLHQNMRNWIVRQCRAYRRLRLSIQAAMIPATNPQA